jgi:His/Glu/Gln/Arg/opine family amino acid ABC transporter permease subunit
MTVLADFDWSYIWGHRDELRHGLRLTLEISAIGIAGAFAIGVILGAARAHRIPVISQLAAIYVELIRNTPILVQIFLLFFGLPRLSDHLRFEPFTYAWLAVMIWGGAFNTENFRAGFEAVPARYREAALALGFTRLRTFLNITLPIGFRISLPSTINTYVSVMKNTALLTAVAIPELTNTALDLLSTDFRTWEMLFVLAVTYLALVWALSGLIRVLERRLALPESA